MKRRAPARHRRRGVSSRALLLDEHLKTFAHAAGENQLACAERELQAFGFAFETCGATFERVEQPCAQQKLVLTLERDCFQIGRFARTPDLRPIDRRRQVVLAGMPERVCDKFVRAKTAQRPVAAYV